MNSTNELDSIRSGALARIDAAERRFKTALIVAALLEAVLLAAVLLLTDFKDRTQVIVFMTSVMVYSVLAVGLVVLGTYTRLSAERVLKAIALLHERSAS
jgi:ABC-type tungstate transport system substrate-binding protein